MMLHQLESDVDISGFLMSQSLDRQLISRDYTPAVTDDESKGLSIQ